MTSVHKASSVRITVFILLSFCTSTCLVESVCYNDSDCNRDQVCEEVRLGMKVIEKLVLILRDRFEFSYGVMENL